MSSSSSTTPVNRHKENLENRFIRYCLVGIWGLLIFFGFISQWQPQWLVEISSDGKTTEAKDLRDYGNIFLKQGHYKKAVAQYSKAVKIQPDLKSAIGNLGIAYTQLHQYDKAINIFEHLLKIDDENIHTNYYNLAEIYKRNNDVDSAIEHYILSAESNPYPLYSYQYLGEIYLKEGNWQKAIEAFENALDHKLTLQNSYIGMLKDMQVKTKVKQPEVYDSVTSFLDSSTDLSIYDNTIFNAMLRIDKELAKTYNFLGYALQMDGNIERAEKNYNSAIDIWPNFKQAMDNLRRLDDVINE